MSHLRDAFTDLAGKSFRILLYHSISDERQYHFAVSPSEFAWQMEWIYQQKVSVKSLEEVLGMDSCTRQGHQPQVVISFDDGYEDNFTNAMPILQKYGYCATFFVVTDFVGTTNLWATNQAAPRFKLMNWEQIIALSEKGHIIGSHAHRHVNLQTLDSIQLEEELTKSRLLLLEKLDQDFLPFAYPYGKHSESAIAHMKRNGYNCALMAGGFWGNHKRTDPWQLKREDINQGTSRRDFMARVRGAVDPHYIKLGFKYFGEGATN